MPTTNPTQNTIESRTYSVPAPAQKKVSLKARILVMMSIILTLAVVVGSVFVYISYTQNKNATPSTPVTLTFWGRSIEPEVMSEVIADFETQNPLIKVRYEKQLETNYKERLMTRLEIQNITALPDVAEIEEVWAEKIQPYAVALTDSTITGRYSEATQANNTVLALDAATKKPVNAMFALPYKFDSLVLAYNREHIASYLAQQNLSEIDFDSLDWTGLKNRTRALTVTRATVGAKPEDTVVELIRGGIAIGSPATVTNADKIIQLLLIQNNANIYSEADLKVKLGDKFNEIMNFYTQFNTNDRVWDDTLGNDLAAFAQGRVSMVLVRSNDIDSIEKQNPSLDFVTALPAKIGSIQNISLSKSLMLPKIRPYQAQTMKFIEYLSRPEVGTKLHTSKNTNTFIPAQTESLNAISKNSPFYTFANINPSAKKFRIPEYESVSAEMKTFLETSYNTNFRKKSDVITRFNFNAGDLELKINRVLTQ